MYDSKDRLDISAFSDTPPKRKPSNFKGRAQLKYGGSTLLQALQGELLALSHFLE